MKKILLLSAALCISLVNMAATDLIVNNATFTAEYLDLNMAGTSTDGKAVALTLYGWKNIGYNNDGAYEAYALIGTIDGVPAGNMTEAVSFVLEGTKAVLTGLVEDTNGNAYNLTLSGDAPKADTGDTIYVKAYDLQVKSNWGALRLQAHDVETGDMIDMNLVDGEEKGYGDYGWVNNEAQIESARYKDIFLEVNKDSNKAIYYEQDGVKIFEGVFSVFAEAGEPQNPDIYVLFLATEEISTRLSNTVILPSAHKTMVNGQLIMERNGVKYNAQGSVVNN